MRYISGKNPVCHIFLELVSAVNKSITIKVFIKEIYTKRKPLSYLTSLKTFHENIYIIGYVKLGKSHELI